MIPKHIKKVPDDRKAVAPYNFVELPDKVVTVAPATLFPQDQYHQDRHTGKIVCTLTTESPLYTRGGWTPEEFAQYGDKPFNELPDEVKQKRAGFFVYPVTQQPTIPGSSIRGMLRNLVEIVSFSKIEKVAQNKLFYRSLGDPALKTIYMANFVEDLGKIQHSPHPSASCYRSKVRAGHIRKQGNSYVIEECNYGRIDSHFSFSTRQRLFPSPLGTNLYQGNAQGKTPDWKCQHKKVYIQIDSQEQDYFFSRKVNQNDRQRHPDLYLRFRKVHSASFQSFAGSVPATLVITGDMQHKHLEFAFLRENLKEYLIPEEIIRRFHDDDQLTKWQKEAFPVNMPSENCRPRGGYLRDGEPVFFLLDDQDNIRFFGRAQMFRLPYSSSPLDFVPEILRKESETDIAEAIFGYVDGKEPREVSRAGRVCITDGILKQEQEPIAKKSQDRESQQILLSSPKPTTFQHYLVQNDAYQLQHYASQPFTETESGSTAIRGHKLYWHKACKIEVPENSDTQTSLIKPIDSKLEFTFNIHFETLSSVELGALLWVLSLTNEKSQQFKTGKVNEKYWFSLGMGKPLGMGAVKIDYELYLSDRTQRYQNLFNGSSWDEAESATTLDQQSTYIDAFEHFMLDPQHGISENDHPEGRTASHLNEVPRIEMLLAMLRCDAPKESTEYMALEDYKQRKVLPTPIQIRYDSNRDYRRFANSSNSQGGERKRQSKEKDRASLQPPKAKGNKDVKRHDDRRKDSDTDNSNPALQRPTKPKS